MCSTLHIFELHFKFQLYTKPNLFNILLGNYYIDAVYSYNIIMIISIS